MGSREQKSKRSPSIQRRSPQKPRKLLTRDAWEGAGSVQKGRTQLRPAQQTHMEQATATATKDEGSIRKAKEFKDPMATHRAQSDPDTSSQSLTEENLLPLTPRQLAAFQDIFKLFSCSPTGTVDMRSMKVALRNVGIQLGPQEMCEALRLADLDGDGIVSFKDFLGVLTDNNRLAQCIGQMKSNRVSDPQGLHTLFLEVLFKLLHQGFLPSKSGQEVTSYYQEKQRALRLTPGLKIRNSQGHPSRSHAGLNFFCQAARVSGLSSSELALSLHKLHKAGSRSPYSQIPNLTRRMQPDYRIRSAIPVAMPDVRLPKPHQPSRTRISINLRPLCKGPLSLPPAALVSQPSEQIRPLKLAPSPPTLVQKQPFSPSPACSQRSAVKSSYK
ncbi:PREDICTED: EF-hand calcium-binding domain-containing protein 3-like [Dipodomys ordii]|uniref:EF-hand calcium-binding domain-containing protein 3-like n=1 Tax=Dipodomys ordii TaxID=10020 RepID=A0A1S3GF99_DIPOR|nr:PREDICTED: EF-hand calcium-binding domain-containing protein 3-like [Dipodomys ordii]